MITVDVSAGGAFGALSSAGSIRRVGPSSSSVEAPSPELRSVASKLPSGGSTDCTVGTVTSKLSRSEGSGASSPLPRSMSLVIRSVVT